MAKNTCHFQLIEHKSVTRDRFMRTVNPAIAVKLRAILEQSKKKGAGRE